MTLLDQGSYVRITQDGEEDCYWDWQEWSRDPQGVLGATLVSMRSMVTLTRATDYRGHTEAPGRAVNRTWPRGGKREAGELARVREISRPCSPSRTSARTRSPP